MVTFTSKLFNFSPIEIKDELEERFERSVLNLHQQISGLTEKGMHDHLSQLVCKDKQHEEICIGFLYTMLTEPQSAQKTYRDLTLLTRDGMNLVVSNLTMLIAEKFVKLTDIARAQLIWLLRELIKHQVLNVENIVWNCLRQAIGGDTSSRNIYLIESLLDIFIDYRPWIETQPFVIQMIVYTYMRLIDDHAGTCFAALRQKEIKFVISLIRERFMDVLTLGRDFARLIQNCIRFPEIEQLWLDILNNPKTLHPTFNGLLHLLSFRTSRRFIQCRITPDMERKMHFLASSVKFGNQKRYQEWFQERYLTTIESQSLRGDLVRFIVNIIHPTNDMLCSDIIPRWAIIGWLISSCTLAQPISSAKTALFYDWLFFDQAKDNIMNVEPGILVMYHSMRSHPFVSVTLLEYLIRIMKTFCPKYEEKFKIGIYNSLNKILEKQVVPNFQPVFESPRLDRDLRIAVREHFREYLSPAAANMPVNLNQQHIYAQTPALLMQTAVFKKDADQRNIPTQMFNPGPISMQQHQQQTQLQQQQLQHEVKLHNPMMTITPEAMEISAHLADGGNTTVTGSIAVEEKSTESVIEIDCEPEAAFSEDDDENEAGGKEIKTEELTDDDDDLPLSKVRLKEKPTTEKLDLPEAISDVFDAFINKKTSNTLEAFLLEFRIIPAAALDEAQLNYVVSNVCCILRETLPQQNIFPDSKTDERNLAKSISYPLFGLYRFLYENDDKSKKPFQTLLAEICERIPEAGYLLLYFMKVHVKLQIRKNSQQSYQFKTSIYRQLCDASEEKIEDCLAIDLDLLETENTAIFLWLLPDIYREFKANAINNNALLHITLRCIDAKNLRDLMYSVAQGKLTIFKQDGLLDCIRKSLTYETYEQLCLWQLVQAHDVPFKCLQDILPELESSSHSEALGYMLLWLKTEEPNNELIRLLLSREPKTRGDPFVTSVLRFWCQRAEEKLSEIIASLLRSKYPSSSPNKRKRPAKGSSVSSSSPTADQVLSHLEHYRRSCRHGTGTGLYIYDTMQRALQAAFTHSNESTKKQYSDLFALAAEEDTTAVGRRGGSGRGRKQPSGKKDTNNHSNSKKNSDPVKTIYSSDEESSEDDWSKQKASQTKKRKKVNESD